MKLILAAALLLVVFALWPRRQPRYMEVAIPFRESLEVDFT